MDVTGGGDVGDGRKATPVRIATAPDRGGDDAERSAHESRFGSQIRALRKEKALSLKELALRSGVSVALISQIERGLSAPSLRSLRLIARGLDVSVGSLFSGADGDDGEAADDGIVVRHQHRRVLDLGVDGTFVELLTPPDFAGLQTFQSTIAPDGGSPGEYDSHEGTESGVVLCGTFDLWLDGRRHRLGPGDSFSFQSRTPHRYHNPSKTMTQVIWAITPPIY